MFDPSDTVGSVLAWRCPECYTVQSETTRCWRCDKPAFTCESCRSYRPSVAADLGYCARDPERTPLRADEVRACWESADVAGPRALSDPVASERSRPRVKPPLEDPGRAAWVEPDGDALVEAPKIAPGKRLSTEVQRRRWRWFR